MGKLILGIDQGLANIGYAIIGQDDNGYKNIVKSGSKKTSSKKETSIRLGEIYDFFDTMLNEYPEIEEIAMEEFFYGGLNYARSVSIVTTNQVSGVLLLLARNRGISVRKIQPTHVKKTVTGKGNANKEAVMDKIKEIFSECTFKTDHECDAVAIGMTALIEDLGETL